MSISSFVRMTDLDWVPLDSVGLAWANQLVWVWGGSHTYAGYVGIHLVNVFRGGRRVVKRMVMRLSMPVSGTGPLSSEVQTKIVIG